MALLVVSVTTPSNVKIPIPPAQTMCVDVLSGILTAAEFALKMVHLEDYVMKISGVKIHILNVQTTFVSVKMDTQILMEFA